MKRILGFFAAAAMVATASAASAVNIGNIVVKTGAVDTVYKAKHVVVGLADSGEKFTVNGIPVTAYKTGTWGLGQLAPWNKRTSSSFLTLPDTPE